MESWVILLGVPVLVYLLLCLVDTRRQVPPPRRKPNKIFWD